MKYLKPIRVVVAILFLLVTTSLFFNFNFLLSGKWDNFILSFQFLPSFLKLIRGVSFMATGFVASTLLALVFGRWYCSFICPLGILQDILIRINKFLLKKKKIKYTYKNSLPWLKYLVLSLSILSIMAGSGIMFIIFDPYSNFGRISTHVFA